MKRNLFLAALLSLIFLGQGAIAETKKRKTTKKRPAVAKPLKKLPVPAIAPQVSAEPLQNPSSPKIISRAASHPSGPSRFKLNTGLGMAIVRGSALNVGMQFGVAPSKALSLFFGPDFSFSLYSPGSIFFTGAGGWYEFRWRGSEKLITSLGAVAGPAFISRVGSLPPTNLGIFLDTAIAQEVDDLFLIRGQVRPGIIGKNFAFMMNFSVSFRFP